MANTSGKHELPAVNSAASRARYERNRSRKGPPTLFTARGYTARGDARYAASRICVSAEPDAWRRPSDDKWVPIVKLRDDQNWQCEHIGYMGCVPWPIDTPLPGPIRSAAEYFGAREG